MTPEAIPDPLPSEEQIEADQLLALRTLWATLTGGAALVSPVGGAALAALTPIADQIAAFAVQKLGRRRVEQTAEMLRDAASASGQPLGEFIERAVADEKRHELLARTARIAQDTAMREKRLALGRALVAGVMGDEATIDDELMFIRAVEDIDAMHIRLLARLAHPTAHPGWTVTAITEADPGLFDAVYALLETLQLPSLAWEQQPEGFYRALGV